MKNCLGLATCFVLIGCTTPPVVLQQASQGALLTGEFAKAIATYEAHTKVLDAERREILLASKASSLQFRLADVNASQVFALAGQGQLTSVYGQLRNSSDTIAKAREDARAEAKKYADEMEALMGALPDLSKRLGAVGTEFTGLGTELSSSQRLKAVTDAFAAIKAPAASASASAAAPAAASSGATPAAPAASGASAAPAAPASSPA